MANKISAQGGSSLGGQIKTLIIIGAIAIIANVPFISIAKAQNSPSNYYQAIKNLPAPVQNLGETVKQTINNAQTPSSQNIDYKTIANWIGAAFAWIANQFESFTGITFGKLFSTIINFFIWLIKIIIGIVVGIINFISYFTKK